MGITDKLKGMFGGGSSDQITQDMPTEPATEPMGAPAAEPTVDAGTDETAEAKKCAECGCACDADGNCTCSEHHHG